MSGVLTTGDTVEDVEYMDTFEEHWRWFYQAECGEWHMFEINPSEECSMTNYIIEQNYSRNKKKLEYSAAGCMYRIDFAEMKQTNLTTGKDRPIKRGLHTGNGCRFCCEKHSSSVPPTWETNLPFQLIPLDSDTQECKKVVKQLKKTMPDVPINSVQRIQNLKMWESFCRKREEMRMTKQMNPEERMLFHGTAHKNIRSICTSNFDLKYAGSHGHVYGKGIYFARHASYSKKYCHSPTGHNGITSPRTMLLARVLVGEYTLGDKDLSQPVSKDRTGTNFYDSCVDEFIHPNIFVVFDSSQVYPEYLIEF
ncbi:hypothetical protein AGOR_G00180370 [Albula goreensis]|uniref:Poly [ADP-ribose] polymerase n=1 Tax=Albula goreensis TaxID=1534307 RepID=A0A8T3CS32_9TELE|nr:hypothetical protein AGOR_G00180370 [Albula goreensis]